MSLESLPEASNRHNDTDTEAIPSERRPRAHPGRVLTSTSSSRIAPNGTRPRDHQLGSSGVAATGVIPTHPPADLVSRQGKELVPFHGLIGPIGIRTVDHERLAIETPDLEYTIAASFELRPTVHGPNQSQSP